MRKLFLFLLISTGSLFAQVSGGARLSAGPGTPPAALCTQPALGSVYTQTDAAAGQANWHCRYVAGNYAWELQGGGGGTPGGASGAIQYNGSGTFGGAVLTGLIKANGSSAPTAAVAGTDYPGLSTTNTWTQSQNFNKGLQASIFTSNVDFICEGDSITAGFGLTPTSGRYCNVVQNYAALNGHVTTYQNFAVAGNQVSDLVARYVASVKPYCQLAAANTVNATLLNVWVGTNDLGTGGASAATTYSALSSYWATAKADGCTILAYTITPRSGTQALSDAQENQRLALNDLIRTSSGWDYLMDVDALIQNPESTTYFQDGLHPTASGHFFIAQALNSVLLGTKWAYGPLFHQYHAPGTGSNNSRDNVISFASMTTGGDDTANGYQSGAAVTSSTDSTFFGYQAGKAITTGNQNTAIGSKTLQSTTTDTNSTAVGYAACFQHTGSDNTCVGQLAMQASGAGNQNTAVGSRALAGDTTGSNNIGIGFQAGQQITTGNNDIVIGSGAPPIGVAQNQVVLIGNSTATAADNSTAVGFSANKGSTATNPNTAIGAASLWNSGSGGETGGNNTAIGAFAGDTVSSGTQNAFVGDHAGDGLTTGSGNEALGYNAKLGAAVAGAAQIGNGTNSTSNTLQFQTINFLDNAGNFKATTLLATGIVDGQAPITLTTGATATLGGTYNSGYTFNQNATAATAITYTLPTAVAGKQYCIKNSYNGSAADTGTLKLITSAAGQFIISNGVLSLTGGYIISGGAAGDALCAIAIDSTHWEAYAQSGTWTLH